MEIYFRILLYIVFGVLPSLIWLFYYLSRDIHPEPHSLILKIFLAGALITLPTLFVQIGATFVWEFLWPNSPSLINEIIKWFVIIALTEELLKYLAVRWVAFNHPQLDEPFDVMLYMIVAALGFAAIENVLYLFALDDHVSLSVVIGTTLALSFIRFIGATFLHTLCSAVFGYFLARSFLKPRQKAVWVLAGLGIATLLHGMYDFSIITMTDLLQVALPIAIVVGATFFVWYGLDRLTRLRSVCDLG